MAKYWREGGEVEDRRSDRESAFERVRPIVEAKAVLPGATKKGVHEMLLHLHNDPPLPGYGRSPRGAAGRGSPSVPRRRRRTRASRRRRAGQLQFDWKEDVRLADANGEVFEFNVWSGTLGHSRRHRFIPTRTRTTDDLLACLLDAFLTFGGIPEECVTDNMSALVAFSGGRRRKVERAWRFAEEAGFRLVLCRPGTPETKGKDESANRFTLQAPRLRGEFTGWEGLLECVARIELRSNEEPNETTGLPPSALFMRRRSRSGRSATPGSCSPWSAM